LNLDMITYPSHGLRSLCYCIWRSAGKEYLLGIKFSVLGGHSIYLQNLSFSESNGFPLNIDNYSQNAGVSLIQFTLIHSVCYPLLQSGILYLCA
jgi:hypothetical protein